MPAAHVLEGEAEEGEEGRGIGTQRDASASLATLRSGDARRCHVIGQTTHAHKKNLQDGAEKRHIYRERKRGKGGATRRRVAAYSGTESG